MIVASSNLSLVDQAGLFARVARLLPRFFGETLEPAAAYAEARADLAQREENPLRVITRGILAVPGGPYRALLEHADATAGEVTGLVLSGGYRLLPVAPAEDCATSAPHLRWRLHVPSASRL